MEEKESGDEGKRRDDSDQLDLDLYRDLSALAEMSSLIERQNRIEKLLADLKKRKENLRQKYGETSDNNQDSIPSGNVPSDGDSSRVPAGRYENVGNGVSSNREMVLYRQPHGVSLPNLVRLWNNLNAGNVHGQRAANQPRRTPGNMGQIDLIMRRAGVRGFVWFNPAFGGPVWRMGGDRGLYGARNTIGGGALPSFGHSGNVISELRLIPYVNPVFFGRGMVLNGMDMIPTPYMVTCPNRYNRYYNRGQSSRTITHNNSSSAAAPDKGKTKVEEEEDDAYGKKPQ